MKNDPDSKICGATKKDGNPCNLAPAKNSTRCRFHGGASPASKQAAQKRGQRRAALTALTRIYGEVPERYIDPVESLLHQINVKQWEVDRLREVVHTIEASGGDDLDSYLTDHPLVWGKTGYETGFGAEGPIDKTSYGAGPNVWVTMLRQAERDLKELTTAAVRAGIEQRRLQIQQQHATMLAKAIQDIVTRLELTPEQQRTASKVIPAVLERVPVAQ